MAWTKCRNCMECYGALLAELLAAFIVWMHFTTPALQNLTLLLGALLGALYLWVAFFWIPRYWRTFSIEMKTHQIIFTRGVLFPRRDIIVGERVVSMTVIRDPFGRLFGTAMLVIYTGGGRYYYPFLPREVAEQLYEAHTSGLHIGSDL